MPQSGLCADLTCDEGIKELYECHCCPHLVCFNHLTEHVEVKKRNKERLESLSKELIRAAATLQVFMEQKLMVIHRENRLIEQAKNLLDTQTNSIDEAEHILEQMNQAIASNRSEEPIVKVEPSLLENKVCTCVCKCDQGKNDQSSSKNTQLESNSSSCLDLTVNTDDEYSMCVDHAFTGNVLPKANRIKVAAKQKSKSKLTRFCDLRGQCPLTFDGAYGLTEAKHSFRPCLNTDIRRIHLYGHFLNKHRLKPTYIRRLLQAIVNGQNPMTTKIVDDDEHDNNNHFHKIPCPFNTGMIELAECEEQNISGVPCNIQPMILSRLTFHLKNDHNISLDLARTLVNQLRNPNVK